MNQEPVLVVMAAGIGSRFGQGIKQLAKLGPAGEPIIDYSVFDAIEAGFKKVIFIIRKDIEADFTEIVANHLKNYIEIEYAFQDMDDLPEGFTRPEARTKPWGTGHAILAAREIIDAPFAVINADDYYGKECYKHIYNFLKHDCTPDNAGMVSFIIKNTLSENGTVTRGVCTLGDNGKLASVHETMDIMRGTDGIISGEFGGEKVTLDEEAKVSMNLWGFHPSFVGELQKRFTGFLSGIPEGNIKAEYLLPSVVDDCIHDGTMTVDVLTSHDRWFGVTYAEDKEYVQTQLADYAARGLYPTPLFK